MPRGSLFWSLVVAVTLLLPALAASVSKPYRRQRRAISPRHHVRPAVCVPPGIATPVQYRQGRAPVRPATARTEAQHPQQRGNR